MYKFPFTSQLCIFPVLLLFFKNHILRFVTLFRFVGVGEASFVSLAAPFIDDNAPQAQVATSGMYMFTAEKGC